MSLFEKTLDLVARMDMSSSMSSSMNSSNMSSTATAKPKMSMGGGSGCKISMLWNWYTIDSCFIARSWHVKSKGGFAGSCIGVFFLVVAAQWLHRFCRELDKSFVRKHLANKLASENFSSEDELERLKIGESAVQAQNHLAKSSVFYVVSHQWLFRKGYGDITADFFEHAVRTFLYTVEWGLSYIIMLLFMYYNGYIIISCILGALVGKFIFSYKEPLTVDDAEDRKCCR